MIYRDSALFGREETMGFANEPFHNLVQRIALEPDGVSFVGKRAGADDESDFFASSDRWCRPVMTRTGPDGALWIADMYRYMIEHPQWLPQQGKDELLPFYREGDDRGRIYRVRKADTAIEPVMQLEAANLVEMLGSSNGWIRDKAQQLLVWRRDKSVVADLEKLAATSPDELARLHALCTLDGLDSLSAELVAAALADAHPGVRENALRLAETRVTPEVEAAALALADDPDSKVRFQLAFTLGEFPASEKTAAGLAKILEADASNPLMVAAVLSSARTQIAGIVAQLSPGAIAKVSQPLGEIALGEGNKESFASLMQIALDDNAATLALLEILNRRTTTVAALGNAELTAAFEQRLAAAHATLKDTAVSSDARISSAALLARVRSERQAAIDYLASQIGPATSPDELKSRLQHAHRDRGFARPKHLLGRLARPRASSARASDRSTAQPATVWAGHIISAIAKKIMRPSDLTAVQLVRLQNLSDRKLRARANKIVNAKTTSTRAGVIAKYQDALKLKGDSERGLAVFQRACIVCHKRGDLGDRDLGPDLLTVANHPPEKILSNILDPNLDIQPGYHAYLCELAGGEQLFGLIAAENAVSITLKQADGTSRNVLRTDIANLRSANISLMPEGLEAAIPNQDMADLIAFLRQPQ